MKIRSEPSQNLRRATAASLSFLTIALAFGLLAARAAESTVITIPDADSRVLNFSGRAQVGTGGNILISGIVVSPGAPRRVLIRAVGPGLESLGVSDVLREPSITLFSGQQSVAGNTRWNTAPNAEEIRAAAAQTGAFPLAENSADSALLATLAPGAYTIQVSGVNGTSGVALVEVYDIDAATPPTESEAHADARLREGRAIFRDDTFGSEAFWTGQMRLHETVLGEQFGGTGPGLSARQALELGLKVDVERLPQAVVDALQAGQVDLDSAATTVELLKLDAVVGLRALVAEGNVTSLGITCALCHSTVDDSFTTGIGKRLDGWPNRDLNVGEIVAFSPTVKPIADLLQLPEDTVRQVLRSWGPGKYDAILDKDGKAFQPDGRSAATVIPAAFGLEGQNLHTYTGWGGVPYWNAYVAVTEMHGQGTFVDTRLNDPEKFPVAVRAGTWNVRPEVDLVTAKLPALHLYQLSLPAPTPPVGSFDAAAAERGREVFTGKAKCATCHVPPLYSEPGWVLHKGAEIGIDEFQASRSPDEGYRTTPLKGLFTREKRGFYHDGRFADYAAVIEHYAPVLDFELTSAEQSDLIEFLKSL